MIFFETQDNFTEKLIPATEMVSVEGTRYYCDPEFSEIYILAIECLYDFNWIFSSSSDRAISGLGYTSLLMAKFGHDENYRPIILFLRSQLYLKLGEIQGAASDLLYLVGLKINLKKEKGDSDLYFRKGVPRFYQRILETLYDKANKGDNSADLIIQIQQLAIPKPAVLLNPLDLFNKAQLLFDQGLYRECVAFCEQILSGRGIDPDHIVIDASAEDEHAQDIFQSDP